VSDHPVSSGAFTMKEWRRGEVVVRVEAQRDRAGRERGRHRSVPRVLDPVGHVDRRVRQRLDVPFGKAQVKDAPQIDADGDLSPTDEEQLYGYYGRLSSGGQRSGNVRENGQVERSAGYDTSGPTTDDAMTRSEEHLVAGTRTEQAGTARLRKYVVTEQQRVDVPVTREEVRLEREPITDANVGNALDGPAISEEEHEVTLHAERPVVTTEAVPVERVRLGKETVTDQETVSGEVRKEQIEFDDTTTGRDRS